MQTTSPIHRKQQPNFDILYQDDNILVLQTTTQADKSDMLQKHQPSFGNFNLGLHVGDFPKDVLNHRNHLLHQINQYLQESQNTLSSSQKSTIDSIYWLNQIHGNHVIHLDKQNMPHMEVMDADAMTTKSPNKALAIMTADCLPIALYQKNTGQIAMIHAGWQGLATGIIAQTYQKFNPKQGKIKAWIGACISQRNYEVGNEVVQKLLSNYQKVASLTQSETQEIQNQICFQQTDTEKYWLDLPKMAKIQLDALGVELNQQNPPACSYEQTSYYSYRRQTHLNQSATGRMATLIMRLT